jgi:tetratricopeptide (TPR) repeat protein
VEKLKFVRILSRMIPIVLFLLIGNSHLGAQESILEVIGTAESNMQPLANVKVTLYKNGTSVRIVHTESNGEFIFNLDINSEYLIEIEKPGYLSKRIAFNTEIPAEVTGRWTMEFAMNLFPGCEGVNTSILNEPVDRIKYSSNKADFISDEGYVANMRGRIAKLTADIEKCKADKFKQTMDEGNRLLDERNFEAAISKFEEALIINPDDRNAQRMLSQAKNAAGDAVLNERKSAIAVSEADRLLAQNDLEAARAKYNEALTYQPNNEYVRKKITELDQMIAAKKQSELAKTQADNTYNQLIAQANAAFNAKNYEISKGLYEQALGIKPDALFPQQKINELEPLIARQKQEALQKEANEKAYREALAMGESSMQSGDLETARQHFNRALTLKPEESYPRQKIAEIDRMIDERRTANLQAQKAAQRQQIEESLNEGDAMLAQENYEAAEAAYQKVLQLDPNDAYARQQITKVRSLQATAAAQKQKTLEKAYSDAVTNGDKLLAAASYQQAVEAYKQALLQKPDDILAKSKLAEAEQKLADEQQRTSNEQIKRKQYDQFLANGNSLFENKRYNEAKQAFQSAANLYPDQPYPRSKITEIDRILAEQQKQKQYDDMITKANALFAQKNYIEAKVAYQQVLAILPSDTYAMQKISEIDAIIKENERLATEQKVRDAQYTRTIQEADNLFTLSKLIEAKAAYQRALALKPDETYPQQQVTKIDGLLTEQAKRQQQENEQKALELQYNQAITGADQLYGQNKLEEAKAAYQRALGFKPSEAYPASQIAKIDAQLAQIEKDRQEKAAFELKYNTIISSADKAYDQRNYPEAKSAYMEALRMKPDEKYPQERLNKIAEFERIIAMQESNRNVTTSTTTSANQTTSSTPRKLPDLNFANDSEREKYLNGLKMQYPEGVTLEIHKEKTFVTNRYIVIRANEVREFRMVKFNWGGVDYTLNGIPISGQYFETQIEPRQGELFQKFEF